MNGDEWIGLGYYSSRMNGWNLIPIHPPCPDLTSMPQYKQNSPSYQTDLLKKYPFKFQIVHNVKIVSQIWSIPLLCKYWIIHTLLEVLKPVLKMGSPIEPGNLVLQGYASLQKTVWMKIVHLPRFRINNSRELLLQCRDMYNSHPYKVDPNGSVILKELNGTQMAA